MSLAMNKAENGSGGMADAIVSMKEEISKCIFGQEDLVDESLVCLLSGAHLIMTGAPGLAKTTLVRVIAQALGLEFKRVQFTPDLMPTDITGSEILNIDPETGRKHMEFSKGPVFTNLMLADEINRASPRTQSSLLEAMQERTVSVGSHTHTLPAPFMVFATQNPFESEGTFPLPEAQFDRFLIHSLVDYPDYDAELQIIKSHNEQNLVGENMNAMKGRALSSEDLLAMQDRCRKVKMDENLLIAVNEIVRMTRPDDDLCPPNIKNSIWYGGGPRAGICLVSAAKAYAFLHGRDSVNWSDVERMVKPVIRHRIRLNSSALRENLNEDRLIDKLLAAFIESKRLSALGISV